MLNTREYKLNNPRDYIFKEYSWIQIKYRSPVGWNSGSNAVVMGPLIWQSLRRNVLHSGFGKLHSDPSVYRAAYVCIGSYHPKQQNMRALNLHGSESRVEVEYRADFRWTSPSLIRTGTANALKNQATTYPVTCLGHVRVMYILIVFPFSF